MTPLTLLAQAGADGGDVGGALFGGGLFLLWLLLVAAAFVLFIWALIDAIKNPNLSDTERIVWIIVIIFVGCLGPIMYLLIGRNKTPRGPTSTKSGI
jgi:hypothetical protein